MQAHIASFLQGIARNRKSWGRSPLIAIAPSLRNLAGLRTLPLIAIAPSLRNLAGLRTLFSMQAPLVNSHQGDAV